MQAIIGVDAQSRPIVWQPEKTINPHMIVTGVSGSGKTHCLRSIIHQLCSSAIEPIRVHLIDVHEDIEVPGASSLKFTSNMPYGFNPLVVDPDPDTGGPQKAVAAFIDLLSKTANYKIGDRQVACIQNLLLDLYSARGFFQNDINSWRLNDGFPRKHPKRFPTLKDAYFFAKDMYDQMFLGVSAPAFAALRDVLKMQRKMMRDKKKANREGLTDQESKDLDKSITNFKEAIAVYIDNLRTGNGDELTKLMKYPNQELMSGVVDRLGKLHFMGIFSGDTPPFDPNAQVWRYCLKSLERDESIMFVNVLAKSIFNSAKARGITESPREFIVIDEARRFQDPNGSIFDVISAEARKFGLALISASQSHSHFTENAIQAAATQIILHQDASSYNKIKSLTGISPDLLGQIKPRLDALVRMTMQPTDNPGSRTLNYERVIVNTKMLCQKLGVSESELSPPVSFKSSHTSQQFNPYSGRRSHTQDRSAATYLNQGPSSNLQEPSRQTRVQNQNSDFTQANIQQQMASKPQPSSYQAQRTSEVDIPDIEGDIDPFEMVSGGFEQQSASVQNYTSTASDEDKLSDLIASKFGDDDDADTNDSGLSLNEDSGDVFSMVGLNVKPPKPRNSAEVLAKIREMDALRNLRVSRGEATGTDVATNTEATGGSDASGASTSKISTPKKPNKNLML